MSEPKRPPAREVAAQMYVNRSSRRDLSRPAAIVELIAESIQVDRAAHASEVEALRARVDELHDQLSRERRALDSAHAALNRSDKERDAIVSRLGVALALLRQARPMVWLEGREWKEWHDGRQAALDATPEAPKETT